LELLQARDFGTFEDTVVERILGEVRKQPAEKILPVRLSAVAQKFLIRPSPQVIAGNTTEKLISMQKLDYSSLSCAKKTPANRLAAPGRLQDSVLPMHMKWLTDFVSLRNRIGGSEP